MRRRVLLPVLVLSACVEATGDGLPDHSDDPDAATPPTVALAAPATSPVEGSPARLEAVVADDRTAPPDLALAWTADDAPICAGSAADAEGHVTCATALDVGSHVVRLVARDADGRTGADDVTFEVVAGEAPTVELVAPLPDVVSAAGAPVAFEAHVADAEDAAEALAVSWRSSLAGNDLSALPTAADAAGTARGFVDLAPGTRAVTVTVRDRAGHTATDDVVVVVETPNAAPTCAIVAPVADAALPTGTPVTLAATAADDRTAATALAYTWTSSVDGTVATGTVASDGHVDAVFSDPTGGVHLLELDVVDADGEHCVDTVTVTIGTPPRIDQLLPYDDTVVLQAQAPVFGGTVTDPDGAEDDLALTLSDDVAGTLWTGSPDATGAFAWTSAPLSVGTHHLVLLVVDRSGLSASQRLDLIVDGAPTAPVVRITPAAPRTDDDLVADVPTAAQDPEGASVTYRTTWSLDGVDVATGPRLSQDATEHGQRWTVSVVASDGRQDGPVGTASVEIANTPPVATTLTLTPAAPVTGDDVHAVAIATDPDVDTIRWSYRFEVDGRVQQEGPDAGFTGLVRGQRLTVTATPSDDAGPGTSTSRTVVVGNAGPTFAAVAIAPLAPTLSDTLTCVPSGWADPEGDTPAYHFGWEADGAPLDASLSTIRATEVPRDAAIRCTATAFDAAGETVSHTSDPVRLVDRAPRVRSATLAPAPATVADTLAVADLVTEDDDFDPVTVAWSWSVDGVEVSTDAALDLYPFHAGQRVQLTLTPSDGRVTGDAVRLEATIANALPVIERVATAPRPPTAATGVDCVVDRTSDADGDPVTVTYGWIVDGVAVAETGAHLGGVRRGQHVTCTATPSDGHDAGAPVASPEAIVVNAAPTFTGVLVLPATPTLDDTLTCTPTGWSDADGDPEGYVWAWWQGATVLPYTTASVWARDLDRDVPVTCTATAWDGHDTGLARTSPPVSVVDRAPVLVSARLTPQPARVTDVLQVTDVVTLDADLDPIATAITWSVDGVPVAEGTSLALWPFHKGQVVSARIVPGDGRLTGDPLRLETTIADAAPTLASVGTSPAVPTALTGVDCVAGATADADGDTVALGYAWTVDGTAVVGSTAHLAAVSRGRVVRCTVTPTDGELSGAPVTSPPVTVGNAAPVVSAVTVTPAVPVPGDTLSCGWTFADVDGDTDHATVAWTIGGAVVGTGATLPSSAYGVGDVVTCSVTAHDGIVVGNTASQAVLVGAGPSITGVTVTVQGGGRATRTSTLVCAWSGFTAPGGGTDRSRVAWTVNGVAVGAGATTLSGVFVRSDVVTCTVTPSDGTHDGAARSASVTIQNASPSIRSAAVVPHRPAVNAPVTCTWTGFSDPDGDADASTVYWRVGNTDAGSGPSLPGGAAAGTSITCTVVPRDPLGDSGFAVSDVVTVNRPPGSPTVSIAPKPTADDVDVACGVGTAATDPDGDPLSYTVLWYRNGVATGYAGGPLAATDRVTVPASATTAGETWKCELRATDGLDLGPIVSSSTTIAPANRAPGAPGITVTPSSGPFDSEAITCTLSTSATDPDGDALVYDVTWYRNGTRSAYVGTGVARGASVTVPASATAAGDTWRCDAQALDATHTGPTVSASVTVTADHGPCAYCAPVTPRASPALLCDGSSREPSVAATSTSFAVGCSQGSTAAVHFFDAAGNFLRTRLLHPPDGTVRQDVRVYAVGQMFWVVYSYKCASDGSFVADAGGSWSCLDVRGYDADGFVAVPTNKFGEAGGNQGVSLASNGTTLGMTWILNDSQLWYRSMPVSGPSGTWDPGANVKLANDTLGGSTDYDKTTTMAYDPATGTFGVFVVFENEVGFTRVTTGGTVRVALTGPINWSIAGTLGTAVAYGGDFYVGVNDDPDGWPVVAHVDASGAWIGDHQGLDYGPWDLYTGAEASPDLRLVGNELWAWTMMSQLRTPGRYDSSGVMVFDLAAVDAGASLASARLPDKSGFAGTTTSVYDVTAARLSGGTRWGLAWTDASGVRFQVFDDWTP